MKPTAVNQCPSVASGLWASKTYKDIDTHALAKRAGGLEAALKPKTVAVVGATDRDGAVGKTVLMNLLDANKENNYEIYPINPTRAVVCGLPAFKDVTLCPKKVDLAVVVTPAKTVKAVVEACGKAGVPVVTIISAGFKELGPEGEALENDVIAVARQYGVRIIGPNCLGVMNPNWGLNATFAACCARKGNVAFISQSGAMCTAMLDWSLKEQIGFSAFVSIGSMADLHWGDIVDYLGNEDETQLILMYMETIGNAEAFLSAVKNVALNKPIIVIKAGQTEAAAAAAASHTGSLAGSHDAFLAAMQRVGVMVLESIGEVLDVVKVLSKQPRPLGPRLAIVTNAGGPGVLATDATALFGADVATLEQATIDKLNTFLPAAWSHSNPVDVLGDANAELYAKTMEVVLEDKQIDGVLVVLSPQSVTEPHKTAEEVVAAYKKLLAKGDYKKPIICSWMGGVEVQSGYELLNVNGIPCITLPDAAAKAYAKIWQATKSLQLTYAPNDVVVEPFISADRKAKALSIMKIAREQGRDILTEAESKLVLKAFGIPIAETIVCSTVEEAVKAAKEVGYPCVVKLNSETITHKSDVGGVKLNIRTDDDVKEAWTSIKTNVDKIGPNHFQGVSVQPMIDLSKGIELLFGSFADVQFGPLVVFGSGGCMVEITRDRSIGLAPLNSTLAARQIENTRIYKALEGGHGERFPGVDIPALNKALVGFSQMVADLSELMEECDINPMLALPDRLVALDARVVLKKAPAEKSPLVVRPYPAAYVSSANVSGKNIEVRPLHPADVAMLQAFEKSMPMDKVKTAYGEELVCCSRAMYKRLVSYAFADYARTIPLAAIEGDKIVGIAYMKRIPSKVSDMEIKVVSSGAVAGIEQLLVKKAFEVAKAEKVEVAEMFVRSGETAVAEAAKAAGLKAKEVSGGVLYSTQ